MLLLVTGVTGSEPSCLMNASCLNSQGRSSSLERLRDGAPGPAAAGHGAIQGRFLFAIKHAEPHRGSLRLGETSEAQLPIARSRSVVSASHCAAMKSGSASGPADRIAI